MARTIHRTMEPWLELGQALRAVARRPSMTAIVVATLGLGIGACTAIFSLGYGILARPFPYPEPERLVRVETVETTGTANVQGASLLDLEDWTRHARSFESAALHISYPAILNPGSGPSQSVRLTFVTSGLFRTLAVRPALGRDFTPAEDQEGGDVHKVILSDGLWRSMFAADPGALGRTLRLRGASYEVIGVMPPGFRFPDRTDVWVTLQARYAAYGGTYKVDFWRTRSHRVHTALARLQSGVAAPAAAAELSSLAGRLATEFPDTNRGVDLRLVPLREAETGALRPYLGLLFGAVAMVLLIVCVNVANLLLAHGAARARELRLRATLGASRYRLVRMLLVESLLLGLAGGLVGALLAWPILKLLLRLVPVELPFWMRIEIDPPVLLFTLALAFATSLLFGVVPAWQMSGDGAAVRLSDTARGASSNRAARGIRSALVLGETALALVLLVGALLMMQSFVRLLSVDAGVRSEGLVAIYVSRFVTNVSRAQSVVPYTDTYERVLARLRELPGVTHVGAGYQIPYKEQPEARQKGSVAVLGQDEREQRQNAPVVWSAVSPGYFEALGIPLLAGRTFSDADTPDSEPVVIVSRRMAETLWPGREAVGQKLLSGQETADNAWARVVGVVGDTRWNAAEAPGFEMYASHRQWPIPASHLLVRVAGDPRALVPLARRVVHEVEPDLAINDVKTMDQIVSESLWQRRLWGALFSAFGVIAVALAALGLYGVLSHAVGQRRRELGVRMALGARGRELVLLLVREGMTLAIAGAALGLCGALALARLVRSLVFGVSPTDPATLAAAFVLLALTALGACLVPALRAARLDPATCLRVD